ncbi:MAG: hypothetical protein A2836_03140 [Candidatus Taylorbacteria bacterium RIFCSPHIGHO2_01_FULL_45_63]|uniref:Antitoxin n=1 Tax=Candidatus Taylorbacteria bacterium RIFCSPHIGHO2_02_FULL_45_35 TaxID=1802311 RepID=A0A1G2MSP6_9BACT|nr:MAG: hypothetical protein A2836_03140 [Candidatus Taylorbacteria bacterium RIFCSPHIGHO2_01_FULL_45_63]OHA26875.1 MAG: hypothetical protein A3D56_04220 [Candidatus Taylorbacteria bacterium RIFCSPHIGHO2_02_FULL_45_35]
MKISEKIIGVKALRENLEKYISGVGKGKSYLVMRRSKPVFRVVPVDEWGDEGVWETVADFSKDKRGGIPADEFLAELRKIK